MHKLPGEVWHKQIVKGTGVRMASSLQWVRFVLRN